MPSRLAAFLILLAAIVLAVPGTSRAALTWRPGEGWVDESTGSGLSASSSRDQLEIAKKLESQKQYNDALKAYRTLVQKYPASTFFEQALDREFAIGNLYLAGEPQRLWKIPLGPSMDKTVEIYQQVIKSAPYGTHAPEAQFKIGLAREKQKKWNDAVDSYTKILDKYPGNSIASDAQYQIGYAWYSSASEAEYDQSAAQKAIEAFEDFIVRYPNSEKVAAANAHIELLKGRQTQGSFNIAKFYEKQKNYKAAYIYYSDVVRQGPGSQDAQAAQKKIDYLRKILGQDVNPEAPAPAASVSNTVGPSPVAPPLPSPSN